MTSSNDNMQRLLSQSNSETKQRLATAVNDLADASRKAHESSYEFMEKIEDLDFAIAQLDRSCRKYLWRLSQIKVKPLQARAVRLARIMDGYLANQTA